MIPKVIHFIFFGFTEFEYVHYLAVKSALKVHKDYQIKLHHTKLPQNNPLWNEISKQVTLVYCEPPTHFNGVELTSFQYKADVKRLEILIQEGGIYMDIDVISLKPFDNLLNNSYDTNNTKNINLSYLELYKSDNLNFIINYMYL